MNDEINQIEWVTEQVIRLREELKKELNDIKEDEQ